MKPKLFVLHSDCMTANRGQSLKRAKNLTKFPKQVTRGHNIDADGWAGAEMRVFTLFDSWSWMDGPPDGRSEALIDLRVRN